jgi:hypothetical protein
MDGDQPQVAEKSGERGRNRTYNLLIKGHGARFGSSVVNCSRHNNLTIKRPAWTVSESVEEVGEIERYLIAKDTKRTQDIYPTVRFSADPYLFCGAVEMRAGINARDPHRFRQFFRILECERGNLQTAKSSTVTN